MTAEQRAETAEKVTPKCSRLLRPSLTLCGGDLRAWWGTDGHNGSERFTTCEKCGNAL